MKKVFDFNSSMKRSHIIGKPRELAWPCEMFRVTLPVRINRNRDLNVFEMCVLKLLSCQYYEPDELAAETCLPPEFIQSVLLRLYDLGKIDEHNQLRPETLAELEKSADADSEIQYETYVIFRERIGGRLLQGIVPAHRLKSEEIVESDRKYAIKKGKGIELFRLDDKPAGTAGSPVNQDDKSNRPSPGDVLSIIRKNKNITLFYDSFRISVSPDAEPCDLRVRLVIQDNADWRICNPFGSGWSLELESSYQQLLNCSEREKTHFQNWMKSNHDRSRSIRHEKADHKPEPFETPENRRIYPELFAALMREERDVYAILEWTLYYALKEVDTKRSIHMLSLGMKDKLEEAIDAFVPDEPDEDGRRNASLEIKNRIPIPSARRLHSFRNDEESAEMQTVLPIALLVAQYNRDFRFHKVFQKHPDCLELLLDLKERRDALRHGRSRWKEIYGTDDYAFMKEFVNTMLPSFRFQDSAAAPEEKTDAEFDSLLSARIKLQEVFDVSAFDRMDTVLQDNLLQAEMFRQKICSEDVPAADAAGKTDKPKSREEKKDVLLGVRSLSAATQCAFRPHLIGARPESATIEYANRKAEQNHLGALPESLRTVRSDMLQRTLDGDDQTLGASVLAWILLSDEPTLRLVASRLPTFLEDISTLLVTDGHANQICMMTGREFDNFTQKTYQLIKTISEV